MTTAHRTANDYETLRAAVLGTEPVRGPALIILRHNGLTSWLKAQSPSRPLQLFVLRKLAHQPPMAIRESPRPNSPVSSPASSSHSPRSPLMPDLKITTDHLKRDAYLYIRQSTLRQVVEHGESTQRQYALRDRAVAGGWPVERIHVIDCDLGKSGANAATRDGFQRLVTEVALGKAGIVMGL